MKTSTILSIIISIAMMQMTSCINISKNTIKGNGIYKEQDYGKMDFNAINVKGSFEVIIADAQDAPVKISGDENLIDTLQVYSENGVLNVHFKKNTNYTTKIGLKLTVPNTGKIKEINTSGSADVITESTLTADNLSIIGRGSSTFKGSIKADKCSFDYSGSANFSGTVEVETIEVDCAGSTEFNISGKADACKLSTAGSSSFKGFDLVVNKIDCNTKGSSDVQITCNEEIRVRTAGSTNFSYKGDAKIVEKHTAGSANIHKI
jgi:Protein of unknown function (DUF2807).